jgi:hypothetical protein
MTTPISPNNLSNDHTANIANQLEGLRVDEPENIVKPKQSSIATACQEFQEAMRVECEAFSRDLTSDLAGIGQSLRAEMKAGGDIRSTFASLRESMDRDHAKLMEQLNVLKEKLDRMG